MTYFNNHQKYAALVLYLIPVALVTGPFLSDCLLSLIGLYFFIVSIKFRLSSYYKNLFVYFFIAFYSYLIIRSFFSLDIYYSLRGCLFYFRYLFFSLGVFYLFANVPNLARNLGLSIFFTLIIVGLDAYYQWIFGENIFGWKSYERGRLSGFFNDELVIGGYLARLTPLCFGLLIYSFEINKKKLLIGILFLIFIDVIIFGSGERAAFFFITLFAILIIILSNNYKLYTLLTFGVSSIIIVFISTYVPDSKYKIVETLNQVSTNNFASLAPYSPLHEEHYISGLKMFADNPIFGQAPNMFDILCQEEKFYYSSCTNHPHNSYIQLMAETGLIGVFFLVFAFLIISLLLFRHFLSKLNIFNFKIPDYLLFYLLGLFIVTWPLIPTGSFFNNWTNVMYYFPVGFVLHYFYNKKI